MNTKNRIIKMVDNCEWSITCGVKKELRDKYTCDELLSRLFNILIRLGGLQIVVCVENYSTTGYHVHAYYYGKNIFWKDFNSKWEIGYVKNRNIYNKEGWIKYIKKQEKYLEYGIEGKKTIIERFTGLSLDEVVDEEMRRGQDVIEIIGFAKEEYEEEFTFADEM